jgi:ribonuclease/clavin/mitogillin
MTLSGTNCYLVSEGIGPDLTLIDTGSPAPSASTFVRLLTDHLRTTGGIIRDIVLTHHHVDHVGGLEAVLTSLRSMGAPEPQVYKFKTPTSVQPSRSVVSDDDLEASVQRYRKDSSGINWLGQNSHVEARGTEPAMKLRVLYTPGHTSDSISLWLDDTGELFVGDTILG